MKLKKWCEHVKVVGLKTPQGFVYWYALAKGTEINQKIAGRTVIFHADLSDHNFCPVCGKAKPGVKQ